MHISGTERSSVILMWDSISQCGILTNARYGPSLQVIRLIHIARSRLLWMILSVAYIGYPDFFYAFH